MRPKILSEYVARLVIVQAMSQIQMCKALERVRPDMVVTRQERHGRLAKDDEVASLHVHDVNVRACVWGPCTLYLEAILQDPNCCCTTAYWKEFNFKLSFLFTLTLSASFQASFVPSRMLIQYNL